MEFHFRSYLRMWAIGLTGVMMSIAVAGCGFGALELRKGAPIRLWHGLSTKRTPVELTGALAQDIRRCLTGPPERADEGQTLKLAALTMIEVDQYRLVVVDDSMVLSDAEGVRIWQLVGLKDRLDEVIADNPQMDPLIFTDWKASN